MLPSKGNLQSLTGGSHLKIRVQHPKVHERKDRGNYYWFFRYREDEVQPDGTVKTTRRFHIIAPSRGEKGITLKQANLERDRFLLERNAAPTRVEAAIQAVAMANDPGQIIFGRLAELWRASYVEKNTAGRPLVAKPTREKYLSHLEHHILPRWKDARLADLRAAVILGWLQEEATSWHMMADLRGVMSGIITKAIEWEIIPETFANPIHRVKLPKKWEVREKRILSEEQTEIVLARLDEPGNLLICETCLDTGTRISEVTGLKIKYVDLEKGTIQIAERNWRGDIDVPKTDKSKRILALGGLTPRYRTWIENLDCRDPDAWVFPQENDQNQPRWDSGVRQTLKRAAAALNLDFPGFGPHSLRRANITWRQQVGATSIEASRIAGHTKTKVTDEYTLVPLKRQEDLTRRIQEKRAKAARKVKKVVEIDNGTAA
jgi:integrase